LIGSSQALREGYGVDKLMIRAAAMKFRQEVKTSRREENGGREAE